MCCLILHSKYNFLKVTHIFSLISCLFRSPYSISQKRNDSYALAWPRNHRIVLAVGSPVPCRLGWCPGLWRDTCWPRYSAGLLFHPQVHQTVIFRILNFHSSGRSIPASPWQQPLTWPCQLQPQTSKCRTPPVQEIQVV